MLRTPFVANVSRNVECARRKIAEYNKRDNQKHGGDLFILELMYRAKRSFCIYVYTVHLQKMQIANEVISINRIDMN